MCYLFAGVFEFLKATKLVTCILKRSEMLII